MHTNNFYYIISLSLSISVKCLTFMRTDTEVEGREVLAVWMKGALKYVSQTSYPILSALKGTDSGRTQIKRDFLCEGSDATCIKKNENSVRQSCITIFLDALPTVTKEKLKEGRQYRYCLHACSKFAICFSVTKQRKRDRKTKRRYVMSIFLACLCHSLKFAFQLHNKERRYLSMDVLVHKLKLRSILHACLNQALVKNNQSRRNL